MVNQPDVEPDTDKAISGYMTDEESVVNAQSVPSISIMSSGSMLVPMHEYQTSRETELTLPDSQYHSSQYHSSWSSLPNCDFVTKSNSQQSLP